MSDKVTTIDVTGSSTTYYAPTTITSSKDIIHVSGQAGISQHGNLPADYESQIHLALLNLQRILVAAKASVSNILKLTLYIVDYDPAQRKHAKIIQKFLGTHRPAITLVPVSQLAVPGWLFEIDAVVARNALPTAQISRSLSGSSKVDVVVIGAGLAGLTAAQHVLKAGYTCMVLEARNRVGGRTWSQKLPSGGTIDLGAAWINDSNQSRMITLARVFGAELITQNTTGNIVLTDIDKSLQHFPYGELPGFSEDIKQHLAHIRDTVEADCQSLNVNNTNDPRSAELDSMTFLAYLQKLGAKDKAVHTATIWTRAMLGQEPSDISALFFLYYCKAGGGLMQMRSDCQHGGQYLRVRQGTQMFATNLADTLPEGVVQLNSPASSIDQVSPKCTIVSCPNNGRTFQARKVLCALPPPAIKKIEFTPPLPASKKLLLDSYRYGYYQKVMIIFKSAFWLSKGSCGLVQSFTGPAAVIRDTSVEADGKHVLTCFMAGTPGAAWSTLPTPLEKEESLLQQVSEVFNDSDSVRFQYIEMIGHQWNDEEWSGYGCPSPSTPPGVLSAVGDVLKSPVGDLHFAGTETSDTWRGYMEGAVRSGDREANAMIGDLRGVSAKL